jgi:signal transduction histidine kinase
MPHAASTRALALPVRVADAAGSAAPPARPFRRGRLPLVLIAAAAVIMASQVSVSFSMAAGIPALIGAAALGLAAACLVAPALMPALQQLVRPEAAAPAFGFAAYGLSLLGIEQAPLAFLLNAGLVAGAVATPSSVLFPPLGAAAAAIGYSVATLGRGPWSQAMLGVLISCCATGLLMSVPAWRARRAKAAFAAERAELRDGARRVAAENAAMKDASEVAAAVLQVANGITAAHEPSAIADQIVRGSASQLRAVGALLLLWDETIETFRVGAIYGSHAFGATELRQVEVRPDTLPSLGAPATGEVVHLAPNTIREPILRGLLQRWKAGHLLGVRLQRGAQLRGLLLVARGDRPARFSARDARLLAGIAVHAAAALDHANLIADLQSANQLKEEFMATMSHELRTPLNVIIGYTDLQLEGAFGDLGDEHRETLGTVRQQALQLLELIQATLDMSRLERGLMTVDLRDITAAQLFEQLQVQVPLAWRKAAVELHWRAAPGLPPIRTDPNKLQILLRNLIHNALKFTHHGMVTVSVSARPDREQLTFVVQDSGMGIKAEHLSEIFEMFRQAPDGASAPGGVGLGLYIVKRLAAVLGAEIDVSSAPGRGATFRIHVPIAGPLAARA